jgi:hypothetical protein
MLSTQKPKPAEPVAAEPTPAPVAPAPPTPTTAHETILSMDLVEFDIEGPTVHEGVPPPPKCIRERFERNAWVWRWLSKPHVDKKGKRMYTVYAPTPDEKIAIDAGDCPAGVRVSVDNLVCWGEDAFLGYLPRRFFEQRQAELNKMNARLTKSSKEAAEFTEYARRAGFKSPTVNVEDERPRFKGR